MSRLHYESQYVIQQVEQYLDSKLQEHKEFNEELNYNASVEVSEVGPKVQITSLSDTDTKYQYEVSDILYWVERDTYYDELEKWNGIKLGEKHRDALTLLKSSNQLPIFLDFVEAIKRNRIAPFIGAGASLPADYPAWGQALEGLAKTMGGDIPGQVKDYLDNYRYLEAAEILYQHNEHVFKNYVQTEFRLKAAQEDDRPVFPPVIDLLPELAKSCIVTTNFDRLIEKKFELVSGKPLSGYMYGKQEQNGFVSQLLKGQQCLMKLHGDYEQAQSYVFTNTQYSDAYGIEEIDFKKQLPRSLRQIYISYSLVFIGCSLEQDRTLELFKSVIDQGHFEIPSHYAFLADCEPESKADKNGRLLSMQIKPVWYPVEGHDHSMLIKLLKLAIDVANKKLSLGSSL
ncbi:SIR2_2 domain-containing protein [Vibrio chagasii]|nr:SIR2_2 domain-containing protein [Vibrio chagasii]CAH6908035.1 SIR2_2 domain-containing protein [Vibrio chagasii]